MIFRPQAGRAAFGARVGFVRDSRGQIAVSWMMTCSRGQWWSTGAVTGTSGLLWAGLAAVQAFFRAVQAYVDVMALRWLAGQQSPDCRSIGRFRKRHLAALKNVFLQALELCRSRGQGFGEDRYGNSRFGVGGC